ncbi:alpha-amylase family glycosyl hydrolase [Ekhidna sp.]|uniref:alpha-amylase family glycosyl hydrolase n=1 Tax=Ekhidna sp. TaxID=2608089 RepID=UPI003B50C0D9
MYLRSKALTPMRRWFLLGSLFILFGCKADNSLKTLNDPLVVGLASPIKLDLQTTYVVLEDYVLNPERLDSVTTDGPFFLEIDNSILTITGRPKLGLYNLTFWDDGVGESVLLKRTKKTMYSFLFPSKGSEKKVMIKGEFNAWNPNNTVLEKKGNSFTTYEMLSPGTYQYLYVVDGKEFRDPHNPDSISNGMGGWNSVIEIQGPEPEKLPTIKTSAYAGGGISLTCQNPIQGIYAYWNNTLIPNDLIRIEGNEINITLPENAKLIDRSKIRLWAYNDEGVSNDVLIPLNKGSVVSSADQLGRNDYEAMVMYFLMVDRFNNGNPTNDKPLNIPEVHPKADYFGGDLAGITQKIQDGYFQDLGTNTIWLSPITQNPEGAFGKYPEPETSFSAYHGYWPISNVRVDYRFGSGEDFRSLVNAAHDSDMNVLLDYVANHVHEQHPIYQENPDWATNLYLPDGSLNTERWDDHRLTTWFDTFMPTLDLSRMETVDPMTDSAIFWLKEYGIDGFRHDATKHIPEIFWRVLTKKVKQQVVMETEQPVFQIGETYGSHELIKSYISTGMLDAQFDFNMYDRAVSTFAGEGSMSSLANALRESIKYYGDHNLMGYITGNQDRPRFISYADGSLKFGEDTKYAGWNREISIQDTLAYQKLSALTAYMMSIPGIPCLYYGDEYGSPGGNDPDNRRQMQFDNLDRHQLATRERTKKMIELRRNNLALIYGDTEILEEGDTYLVISRQYFDNQVISVFNIGSNSIDIEVPAEGKINFYGELNGEMLTLPPNSFEMITIN